MVRGRGIAVTAVALMYQCALITRMARGRGAASPNARQAAVYRFTSRAFIGLPWPKNAAGMIRPGSSGLCVISASWIVLRLLIVLPRGLRVHSRRGRG